MSSVRYSAPIVERTKYAIYSVFIDQMKTISGSVVSDCHFMGNLISDRKSELCPSSGVVQLHWPTHGTRVG